MRDAPQIVAAILTQDHPGSFDAPVILYYVFIMCNRTTRITGFIVCNRITKIIRFIVCNSD